MDRRVTLRLGLLLAVSAAASAGGPSPLRAQAARTFDPIAFFTGSTEGHGTVDEVLASPRKIHVTGSGALKSGVFVLDQTVRIEGDPATRRQWQLRQTAPGRFSGSVTDATGPVTGVVTGQRMQINYKMKGGMKVEQVLTVAADGRSAANRMKVRKLGIVVATVVETIRKV
jgi:carbon monoxide dehydrogenase subunit G